MLTISFTKTVFEKVVSLECVPVINIRSPELIHSDADNLKFVIKNVHSNL